METNQNVSSITSTCLPLISLLLALEDTGFPETTNVCSSSFQGVCVWCVCMQGSKRRIARVNSLYTQPPPQAHSIVMEVYSHILMYFRRMQQEDLRSELELEFAALNL